MNSASTLKQTAGDTSYGSGRSGGGFEQYLGNMHVLEPWPANTCGRCGAVKQPAGIGLEPTFAEHIENIVDCRAGRFGEY